MRALYAHEELAARSGLSVRHLREIESGRVGTPRTGTVRVLAGPPWGNTPGRRGDRAGPGKRIHR